MKKLPLIVAIPLGCAAGFAAGIGTVLITLKAVPVEPDWLAEAMPSRTAFPVKCKRGVVWQTR
jgi:hypothetical protein